MKYTVDRINPGSVAKVVSVAAAFILLLAFLITLFVQLTRAAGGDFNLPAIGIITIVMPFIYMLVVYIASYVVAHAFNIATRLVGGIQLELSE